MTHIHTETTNRHFIAVVHEYQVRNKDGSWSPVEIRTNNERALPEDTTDAIRKYQEEFASRIGKVHEHIWEREFEGIYGYRWKDVGYQIRTVSVSEIMS